MSKLVNVLACPTLFFAVSSANAESLYSIQTSQLMGSTLYSETLNETGMIAVKPGIASEATGDTNVLSQCLWSVEVLFEVGTVSYSPGKMICIGPQQEVLEAVPVGTISPVGQCVTADCAQFEIEAGSNVVMTLTAPLLFNQQARNER